MSSRSRTDNYRGDVVAVPVAGKADDARTAYRVERSARWDRIARDHADGSALGKYYHRRVAELYRLYVPPGLRVLELGCGTGDLLASLAPASGIGVDFSAEMVRIARKRHPGLTFIEADVHDVVLQEGFDVIILSDLINDLWDVQAVFSLLRAVSAPHTRLFVNIYSHLWGQPLQLAQKLGLMTPLLPQNWLTVEDVDNLFTLSGFQTVKTGDEFLCPINLWPVAQFCNRWLARLWPFRFADLSHFIVARPLPAPLVHAALPTVSVVVPARNEAGNIAAIIDRVPVMGGGTELIFVEGHSTDETWNTIQREMASRPELRCRAFRQLGRGKGDAVRKGFAEARGDILMILDADLTVPPEDLPRFFDAIASGKGEFINGVRLIYPMEKRAMRFLNLLGNKFFSLAFSWLLGQPIKDTLCGTKALWRRDYERIAVNRSYFGEFDPFGDFDLLFGASKLALKILEVPIRYRERTYGDTNIQRFRHGLLLLRMVVFAARKIKFV